ncbi:MULTISPECIES: MmyB family transcriptional regulator [Streptomyces violaceusniger group]|uniref:Helix-turn-helix domain-containing protein n=2 Tax=Streptomyces javensis TaxID=114698 RepID=A0ABS0R8Y4_9ACTN|nr:helix-turn-helix domain-containing protein [Streptomyces javensis]MBI0313419.1 helix-turn-helix domain-containing protein [Streptomyces javensis]
MWGDTPLRDCSRCAKLAPERVGLATSRRRRVPGLRREEVAALAGVSTEWYTRLEKGHISGVSEDVLEAVAQALLLDEDERTYLLDLARAARPTRRRSHRRKDVKIPSPVQWMVDSMTMAPAFVRSGRLDIIASNAHHDRALRELVGELSTLSSEFRTMWASHDVRIRHEGVPQRAVHDLIIYTAEPGTASEDRHKLFASWTAPQTSPTEPPRPPR